MPQSPLDDVREQVRKVGNDVSDAFTFKNQRQKIWNGVRNLYGSAPKPAPIQAAETKKISAPSVGSVKAPGIKPITKTPIIKNQGLKR